MATGSLVRPRTDLRSAALDGGGRLGSFGEDRQLWRREGSTPPSPNQPDAPVRGVPCFVDADWPLIGGSFAVEGVAVVWPKKLKAMLAEAGPLDSERIADLQWQTPRSVPQAGTQPAIQQ